jgi:diguanylate cyclase (GGDEF)-like protein
MFDPAYAVRIPQATARPGSRPAHATELPERVALSAAIERQIGACRRYRSPLAVLCFGIDNLTAIEQRCGQFVEQQVQRLAWARLWTGVREQDIALHTGRGEFGVLIHDALTPIAAAVAARVVALLGEPYRVNDLAIRLVVSSGYAVWAPDGDADAGAVAAAATQERLGNRRSDP